MPVVKGGVWTNIEDEILKAAISKYGLNQWARVSSLLARKTPKQCKARWNEWLDPSIRKTEWSRDEDEKLLHLAKLLPTQWRTIAENVGRTANQCLERYQKLLDEAESREGLSLTGADGAETKAPSADDVRRLRPGEIDPDPETKPARPDTIDLDEDEKEMLSEARARLANTQGKKAKRKARERQQEESRRLAALQKRRELKTAGINIKVVTRKPGHMDYNADIPFERKPAPGFYDTSEELSRNEKERANFDPKKHQLASAKRKGDEDDEEANRKRRKNEKKDENSLSKAAIQAGKMQRIREAEQSSKRRELNLPAPQVSEGELEEIVKMGMLGEKASSMARESDNDATRGLVSDYTKLNNSAPIRTPRVAQEEDHIANEIHNIKALTNIQSSLLGGENTPLAEGSSSTGFDSAAPRKQVVATPNPLATPLYTGNLNATPLRPGETPMRTPRDRFALNTEGGSLMPGATPHDMKVHNLAVRQQLKFGLASLPKPKESEWELEIPEEQAISASTGDDLVEDAAEKDRRENERLRAIEALERRRRTQVMQNNLPRPLVYDCSAIAAVTKDANPEELIAYETSLLVANDLAKYPVPGSTLIGKAPALIAILDADLENARMAIEAETQPLPDREVLRKTFDSRNSNTTLLGLGCYDSDDEDEVDAVVRRAITSIQESLVDEAGRSAKLEKKLSLHLGGYQNRQKTLSANLAKATAAAREASNVLSAMKLLALSEETAINRRLAALREEVSVVSRREREAQEDYRRAKGELADLRAAVRVNGDSAV
ncbi:Pre-mRNA-splicing factor cef-1 [Ceratocystis fimbriata CBS 114723]|uniref:Pre-mRNA-splicing factor cef-1 n=1 Tax=Ceratocystis fimbriata CBS 114723 TaxID=1035309 RepID=A0A2C5X662_9PEZI|nr:Pre-mRNA-splicing factor cef-1 [Ceratocystis fimbriata CBS 114723]